MWRDESKGTTSTTSLLLIKSSGRGKKTIEKGDEGAATTKTCVVYYGPAQGKTKMAAPSFVISNQRQ